MAFELMNDITAFCISKLSVLAYASGFTLWHYKTDVLSDVMTGDYFTDAALMMNKGDLIICSGSDAVRTFFIVSSDDSVVIAPT